MTPENLNHRLNHNSKTSPERVRMVIEMDPQALKILDGLMVLSRSPNRAAVLSRALSRMSMEYKLRLNGHHIVAVPDDCSILRSGDNQRLDLYPLPLPIAGQPEYAQRPYDLPQPAISLSDFKRFFLLAGNFLKQVLNGSKGKAPAD